MKMSLDGFLYQIKQIVTGKNGIVNRIGGASAADGGIKKEWTLPLTVLTNSVSTNPVITDNTTGTASATFGAIVGTTYATDAPAIKNALAEIALILNAQHNANATANTGKVQAYIIPAGTNPTVGILSLAIPRDYDEASDTFALEVFIVLANADASITLTATPTVLASSTFTTGTLVTATLPFSTVSANLSTSVQKLDINLSGLGLKRDNILSITLALAGTTTGNTTIYAVEPVIASCIVSYNDTDSTGIDGSLGMYGNPLR